MKAKSLEQDIASSLRGLKPDRIILFGSRATGNPKDDSDVDLAVVLPINEEPANFRERMEIVHQVRERLRAIEAAYGLDVLVFTRPEWERFSRKKSWFSQELQAKGVRIA